MPAGAVMGVGGVVAVLGSTLPLTRPHTSSASPASSIRSDHSEDGIIISSSRRRLLRHSRRRPAVVSAAQNSGETADAGAKKKVLILGGSGRVGRSTVKALLDAPGIAVAIGGRSRERANTALAGILEHPEFRQCDINDVESVVEALKGVDCVVHTAGPFQRRDQCTVLEAAIASKTPYVDVCDDTKYSQRAKGYHEQAKAAGVPAITTGGIYPGTSNVMAAEMVDIGRRSGAEPVSLKYSYYTAGSGGAGPTLLATTFLLCGEQVITYENGEVVWRKPTSDERIVDFGAGLGMKSVYLYNLPEVQSSFQSLNVPTVSARFGTDPPFWNWVMSGLATFAPKDFLEDRARIEAFAKFSDPMVRLVDKVAGEKVGMRVDLEFDNKSIACAVFVHERLSECVGTSIAAFARTVVSGATQPGVWFPEESGGVPDRRAMLEMAVQGCKRFVLNKAPWQIESTASQIGLGLYW
eukprot:jgi/Chlat1/101/Chrsp1S03205